MLEPKRPQRLFVVDAMAMAFRAFYAFGMGRPLTTTKGTPVAAVFGSAIFMNKLLTEQRPDFLVVACDSKEPTFRHDLYPAYKANRREMPPELLAQLPHFFRLLEAYGAPVLRVPGLEADDLIGTIARRFANPDLHVFIVSGDKDFCQLVNDHTFIYTPKKGDEALIIDRAGVEAKFGVTPEQVIDCLAIIGDASDNIPGVLGIGEKGAAKLIKDFGSLKGVYDGLEQITNKKQRSALEAAREMAFLSQELVTIRTDCELAYSLEHLACVPEKAVANAALLQVCQDLEFKTLANKIAAALGISEGAASGAALATSEGRLPSPTPPKVEAPEVLRAPPEVPGYRLANTKAALAEVVQALALAEDIAFDTETTGLDLVSDRPIGISLAVKSGEAWYVPLASRHLKDDLTPHAVITALRPALTERGKTLVAHNAKFDIQMLANVGLELKGPFVDTMICDWLLDAGGRQHGLDACCLRYFNYEKIKTTTLIGEKGQFPMLEADLPELTRYACEDADFTLRLYKRLVPEVEAAGLSSVLSEIEMPLVPILAKMEHTGVHLDRGELAHLASMLEETETRLEREIRSLAGIEEGEAFNVNSPKQLSDVIFTKLRIHDQLGVRHLKKTRTGYSTDESVLQRLSEHPLPRALLEYRMVAKLKGTYVDALPAMLHKDTGRLHTSFHQTGTATGRLSSSEPNLQNIPVRSELGREIRKAFRPKEPDWVILSADYSQIELRLLAHLAEEKGLAKAFAAKEDIHRSTAAAVFGVRPEDVDPLMRSKAKAINFGIIYGMGARRLAAATGTQIREAQAFIERYFASFPGIGRFIDETVKEAKASGMTRTITGRRRHVLGLAESNQRTVAQAENIAVNTRIQGSAADLIKLAMIKVDERLKREAVKARLLLQVHDELVFECHRDDAERLGQLVRPAMEEAMHLSVPLEVQVGIGTNWLEAH